MNNFVILNNYLNKNNRTPCKTYTSTLESRLAYVDIKSSRNFLRSDMRTKATGDEEPNNGFIYLFIFNYY